jgi:hypothetical protein
MGKPVKPVNRVTRVNTPIIFLNFFMTIFFQFYYFVLNYLPLRFVIFLLFLLFVYYESMLVKLTLTGTRYFKGFFTEFWLLYWVILSKKKKLSWSHIADCWFIKLPRANSSFLFWRCIFWSFLFIFYIRLLGLELYIFFLFLF